MKTVLHIIETGGPGGAETVFVDLIRSLNPTRWRSIAIVPYRGWLYDQLVLSGVEPIVIPERHSLDVGFFRQIAALIKRFDVDIIHGHLFGSAVRAALLSQFCGVPAIATLHGVADLSSRERFRSLKIQIVNRGLSRIVFVSEHLRQSYLKSVLLRKDLTAVIHNGVEIDRFSTTSAGQFRSEFGIAPNEFVVGAIGNPGAAKGYDVMLEAARILRARAPGCRFVIVGELDGGRGTKLIELRRSMELTDDVILTGFRSDIHNALAGFDLYALTSRSEGFSLSVVQAMAAGLPVIATRCGGPEEILEHGVTGLLVENGSAEAVASAIEQLRVDSAKRRSLGAAAREVARNRFALSESVRAYERVYEACLTKQSRQAPQSVTLPPKGRVLITDGEQRAALAAARSLGRAGYEVHVCSARGSSIAGTSRHCQGSYEVGDPLHNPEKFLADLIQLAAATKADVLLPVTEAALIVVLPNRHRFACAIPFTTAAAFEAICDKRAVLQAAKSHGIAVPPQTELATPGDVRPLNGDLQFPLVLKPFRSVAGAEGERIHTGVEYADSAADLRQTLDIIPMAAYPVLVQRRIEGPGFAISVLLWGGHLLAAFAHRRIREKPPSGGVSVLRESIPVDPDLLSRSLALLSDFSWQGVAMVEYKLDALTGIPYLMEINGRLWGSLQLAIDAGVDFPVLLVESALGANPTAVTKYVTGVRSRWEWGDVDHLLACVFHSASSLSLPASKLRHRRSRALFQFLRSFTSADRPEVFRFDDPAPFIREMKDWIRGK